MNPGLISKVLRSFGPGRSGRRFARRALVGGLLLLASPAIGQDIEAIDGGGSGDPRPTVDTHVVEPGDTLWDLSQRILGSAWLWPKVWSFNPEITNPHWIYPGDVIRFYPGEVELPSQTELIADVREIPQDDPDDVYIDEEEDDTPAIEMIDTAPLRARRPRTNWRRYVNLFVTPQELAEAGTLTNAVHDKMLLAANDQILLTFEGSKPSPGQRYMVYRTLGEVIHPIENKRVGYMTQVTGVASIEEVHKKVTRARLEHTVVEVERGQYVSPLDQDLMQDVAVKLATKEVEGVVLAVQFDGGVVAGEQQIVFIDLGESAGLERGNELRVVAQGDPLTGEAEDMPEREFARLRVIQANQTASTCVVTNSVREIEAGDKVVSVTR